MRFIDDNIRLEIRDQINTANIYRFKSYLEKSDVATEIISQQLPFTPISFRNDSIHLRNLYRVSFIFNVFSEDLNEAIKNYDQLHNLLNTTKPNYSVYNSQYIPDNKNLTGILSIKFKGLPKISNYTNKEDKDELKIHLTNFSYTPNTDMGYIEIPYDGNEQERALLNVPGKMRLVPIAYKLTIEGKVLLDFLDTVRGLGERKASVRNVNLNDIYGSAGITTTEEQTKINNALNRLTGKTLAEIKAEKRQAVLILLKQELSNGNIKADGNLNIQTPLEIPDSIKKIRDLSKAN